MPALKRDFPRDGKRGSGGLGYQLPNKGGDEEEARRRSEDGDCGSDSMAQFIQQTLSPFACILYASIKQALPHSESPILPVRFNDRVVLIAPGVSIDMCGEI